jgi:DNA-directed RNA polymerase subunit K/omega
MRVVTPAQVSRHSGSKYLGVLVAAKYARKLNEFRPPVSEEEYDPSEAQREKLTTTSLETVARGEADFRMVDRRRPEQ